jgi:DNA polymerase delta subunit 1
MSGIEKTVISVSAFSWDVLSSESENGWDIICCWCHTEENETVLVRIEDYPCSFYFYPEDRDDGCEWDLKGFEEMHMKLENAMKLNAKYLIGFDEKDFSQKDTLYYDEMNKKSMYHFKFANMESCRHAKNILNKGLYMRYGHIKGSVIEFEIDTVRKLISSTRINYCSWFSCNALKIEGGNGKISTQKNEYITKYKSIKPVNISIVPRPLWCDYDIEVYSHNHKAFPCEWSSRDKIYCISMVFYRDGDSDDKWKEFIILDADCIIEDEKVRNKIILVKVKGEIELINKFCEIIRDNDPDLLSGYNTYAFDNKYISARFGLHGLPWPVLGRLRGRSGKVHNSNWSSSANKNKNMFIPYSPGRSHIDFFEHTSRTYSWDVYTLDNAANVILADEPEKRKQNLEAEKQFEIYAAYKTYKKQSKKSDNYIDNKPLIDMGKLVKYCVYDSRLIGYMANKINWWIQIREMCNVVGVGPQTLYTNGQQIRALSLLYDKCSSQNIVLDKRESEIFYASGGLVQEPIPGLSKKVIVLDFKSLYPSIMIGYNLCYTTLLKEENWDKYNVDEYNSFKLLVSDTNGEEQTEMDQKIKIPIVEYEKEIRFLKKERKIGVLPVLLDNLLKERSAVRKIKTKSKLEASVIDSRQLALKIVANSVYGFTGVKVGGKRPCLEIAAVTCDMGRKAITKTIEWIKENATEIVRSYYFSKGIIVNSVHRAELIYGDTDSCMMYFDGIPLKDIHDFSRYVAKRASSIHPPPLELEPEGVFDIFCVKRKHYAKYTYLDQSKGDYNEKHIYEMSGNIPSLTVKGLTPARRDNCNYVRNIIAHLLHLLMNEEGFYKCIKYVVLSVLDLFNSNILIDNLVITKKMGSGYKSNNAAMKVFAEEMSKNGMRILAGERHKFVVCDIPNATKIGQKMVLLSLYQLTKESDRPKIDYHYYFENLLQKKIDVLLGAQFGDSEDLKRITIHRNGRCIYGTTPAKFLKHVIESEDQDFDLMLQSMKKVAGNLGLKK